MLSRITQRRPMAVSDTPCAWWRTNSCTPSSDSMWVMAAEIDGDDTNNVRGPLRVGCLDTLAPMLTPELVFGFGRAFPGVRITSFNT
jgi:DNA-binding transcriptional LysR family regulator